MAASVSHRKLGASRDLHLCLTPSMQSGTINLPPRECSGSRRLRPPPWPRSLLRSFSSHSDVLLVGPPSLTLSSLPTWSPITKPSQVLSLLSWDAFADSALPSVAWPVSGSSLLPSHTCPLQSAVLPKQTSTWSRLSPQRGLIWPP